MENEFFHTLLLIKCVENEFFLHTFIFHTLGTVFHTVKLHFPNKSQWRKLFALLTKCSLYSGKWVENVENDDVLLLFYFTQFWDAFFLCFSTWSCDQLCWTPRPTSFSAVSPLIDLAAVWQSYFHKFLTFEKKFVNKSFGNKVPKEKFMKKCSWKKFV